MDGVKLTASNAHKALVGSQSLLDNSALRRSPGKVKHLPYPRLLLARLVEYDCHVDTCLEAT